MTLIEREIVRAYMDAPAAEDDTIDVASYKIAFGQVFMYDKNHQLQMIVPEDTMNDYAMQLELEDEREGGFSG